MNPGRATSTSAIGSVRMMRWAIAAATSIGGIRTALASLKATLQE